MCVALYNNIHEVVSESRYNLMGLKACIHSTIINIVVTLAWGGGGDVFRRDNQL